MPLEERFNVTAEQIQLYDWLGPIKKAQRIECDTFGDIWTKEAKRLGDGGDELARRVFHPREVFREVLRGGGGGRIPVSAVVVVHNHPSGSPEPSAADVSITRTLRDGARILDLDLLDHVVVGDPAVDPSAGATIRSANPAFSEDAVMQIYQMTPHYTLVRSGDHVRLA